MSNPCTPLHSSRRIDHETMEARIVFGRDDTWFNGHFPGDPVLPGVAMLASVVELAIDGLGLERTEIAGFNKVRFTKMLGPGDELTIILNTSRMADSNEIVFTIRNQGQKACQGVLLVHGRVPVE